MHSLHSYEFADDNLERRGEFPVIVGPQGINEPALA